MTNATLPPDRPTAITLVLDRIRSALGDPGVSLDDDFFAIGGDSILAVRVIEELRESTGVELPIAAFYTNPTANELGDALAELLGFTDEPASG